jgi:hypothetical protein
MKCECLSKLTRSYVLFVIALQTRRVEIAGIIRQPHGAWMLQVATRQAAQSRRRLTWGAEPP